MIASLNSPLMIRLADVLRAHPHDPILNHCSSAESESDYKGNRCIGVES